MPINEQQINEAQERAGLVHTGRSRSRAGVTMNEYRNGQWSAELLWSEGMRFIGSYDECLRFIARERPDSVARVLAERPDSRMRGLVEEYDDFRQL